MNARLIYTAADSSYALQAQVLLRSLSLSQAQHTHLLVIGNGWSAGDLRRLNDQATGDLSVQVLEVDHDHFRDVRLDGRFPLATAYNILAPDHLIESGGRALYLDADMLVTEDLSALWEMPMDHCVAAVLDAHVAVMGAPSMWRPWREEGVSPLTPYLNTGTMLIDLDKWRAEKITQQTLEFLSTYELPCVDQDALNLVLRGRFDRLSPRYNMMPYHLLTMFRNVDLVESDEEVGRAITDPAIVHFHRSFFGKPWTFGATHPATRLWREIADEVNPRWRRAFDAFNFARGRGARLAGMMKLDSRMKTLDRSLLVRES